MSEKLVYIETVRMVEPADAVPTSWLDPLLSGPDAALHGNGPWGCPDIERLLRAVRERVKSITPVPEAVLPEEVLPLRRELIQRQRDYIQAYFDGNGLTQDLDLTDIMTVLDWALRSPLGEPKA